MEVKVERISLYDHTYVTFQQVKFRLTTRSTLCGVQRCRKGGWKDVCSLSLRGSWSTE